MRSLKSVTHTKTKTRVHDEASSSSSDQATAYSQQQHARPRTKWEHGLSPTSSGSSVSMSKHSLTSSISNFRSDFDELKCKMKIFGESLNLCRCIAHDFKLKLNKMEKRLESLEKRQGVRRQHSHYTAIIQKNKRLSHITLADAQKLKLCRTEPERCEVAARICRNYLSGAWKTVDPNLLLFKRMSGGLSNLIYYISLPDGIALGESTVRISTVSALSIEPRERLSSIFSNAQQSNSSSGVKEPKEVLLRIYGQVHGERAMDAIVTESVIFTLLSERRLGPKLHGVFSGGRIEEYIPARSLRTEEMANPAISMKIAEKMAAIHSMNVPLGKEPTWLWTNLAKWLKTVREENILQSYHPKNDEEKRIINELDHEYLSREIDWLKKYLNTFNSPAVFCHNDLQEGNILIVEDTPLSIHPLTLGEQELLPVDQPSVTVKTQNSVNREASSEECDSVFSNTYNPIEPQLYLIDFEYCAYNYRAFDIANHFEEWRFDYTKKEYPFYHILETNAATPDQKDSFIKRYLKEYLANIYDDQDPCMPSDEEVSQLRGEVEAFALASHLIWSLWSFVNANKSQIPFGYWEYGYVRLNCYKKLKLEAVKNSVTK